jgi:hypothetical protein
MVTSASVAETAAAADVASGAGVYPASISESIAATSDEQGAAVFAASISEIIAATTTQSGGNEPVEADVTEAALAQDFSDASVFKTKVGRPVDAPMRVATASAERNSDVGIRRPGPIA